jgi:Holliday junction resolvase RusA-like endonuclease
MFVMKRTGPWAKRRFGDLPLFDVRKPDVDNLEKSLLDGLVAAGVLSDDSIVFDLRGVKVMHETGGRPHARVAMEWLDGWVV